MKKLYIYFVLIFVFLLTSCNIKQNNKNDDKTIFNTNTWINTTKSNSGVSNRPTIDDFKKLNNVYFAENYNISNEYKKNFKEAFKNIGNTSEDAVVIWYFNHQGYLISGDFFNEFVQTNTGFNKSLVLTKMITDLKTFYKVTKWEVATPEYARVRYDGKRVFDINVTFFEKRKDREAYIKNKITNNKQWNLRKVITAKEVWEKYK